MCRRTFRLTSARLELTCVEERQISCSTSVNLGLARRSHALVGPRRSLARFNGGPVADLLDVGDDHTLAGLEAVAYDVVVTYHIAEHNRLLAGDETLLVRLGYEHEVLAGDAVHRQHRHDQARIDAPDETRAH